jgi:hypothetical protein
VEYAKSYSYIKIISIEKHWKEVANISRKSSLTRIGTVLAIGLVLLLACSLAKAQSDTQFTPTDKFEIPAYNGSIRFGVSGSYQMANLQNDTWVFNNLRLPYSPLLENFSVSARDSNMTITSYQAINSTLTGLRLRYNVTGRGVQTINFGFTPKGGNWEITFNRTSYMDENNGWQFSPYGTLTIKGAPNNVNVSVSYYIIPDELGGSGNTSNLTYFQRHSVIITTTIIVAIAVILVIIIKIRSKINSPEKLISPPKSASCLS